MGIGGHRGEHQGRRSLRVKGGGAGRGVERGGAPAAGSPDGGEPGGLAETASERGWIWWGPRNPAQLLSSEKQEG